MRALVWHEPYTQSVQEVATPIRGAEEVIVAPALVGICGSDVAAHKGRMGTTLPGSIRGHEFAGRVIESSSPDIPVGARVAVNPVVTCGKCAACTSGRSSVCASTEIIGVHRSGALAEAVVVPLTQVHSIPHSLSWAAAASAEPLAQAIHDAELGRRGGRRLGRCLVIGGGTIGAWLTFVLARGIAAGSPETARVDVLDLDYSRLQVLRELGAQRTFGDSAELGAEDQYDTVFDVVGSAQTRREAVERTDRGGAIVAVGMSADDVTVPWFDIIRREITITGANAFSRGDYALALSELVSGRAQAPTQRRVVPLDHAVRVFDALASGNDFTGKTFIAVGDSANDVDEDLSHN